MEVVLVAGAEINWEPISLPLLMRVWKMSPMPGLGFRGLGGTLTAGGRGAAFGGKIAASEMEAPMRIVAATKKLVENIVLGCYVYNLQSVGN
jgi:hypothetical protein